MTRTIRLLCAVLLLAGAPAFAAAGKVTLDFELGGESLVRGAPTGLDVMVSIQEGWHIQAHRPNEKFLIPTVLELEVPAGVAVHDVLYPRPDKASFAFAPGKQFLVHEGKLGLATALELPADFDGDTVPVTARLRYQACDDENCLPPATATFTASFPVGTAGHPGAAVPGSGLSGGALDDSRIGGWIERHGLLATLFLVALLGLGLNLTPCVYPLISVTVSFFGTQAHGSTGRALALALLYVAGISIAFSALGVLAALSGGLFGGALQKPPVLLAIAALMVALSLSCFGLYTLQPPAAVMRVAGGAATGVAGALFMGLTMGLVAAPCVGPIVIGLLTFVGSRQDPVLGFALFTALSLGLGAPYVVLALAARSIRSLPRSGEWLLWTEHLFGFVLLGLAVYFVQPLLPVAIKELALPALVLVAAVYLGFLDPAGTKLQSFLPLKRLAGVGGIALALWMGWPEAASGSVEWTPYSDAALAEAREQGRPAVVDVAAEWCIPCKEMDVTTFRDQGVRQEAESFVMLKLDMTMEGDENDRLTEQFLIRGVPTTMFFGPDGAEVERKVGYVSAEEMVAAMQRARP
jgi:thiol:disulfide interchange protein DsbD